ERERRIVPGEVLVDLRCGCGWPGRPLRALHAEEPGDESVQPSALGFGERRAVRKEYQLLHLRRPAEASPGRSRAKLPHRGASRSPESFLRAKRAARDRRAGAARLRGVLHPRGYRAVFRARARAGRRSRRQRTGDNPRLRRRSEEHTSELQSLRHLVCRLLLEKKKKKQKKKHQNKNKKQTPDQ